MYKYKIGDIVLVQGSTYKIVKMPDESDIFGDHYRGYDINQKDYGLFPEEDIEIPKLDTITKNTIETPATGLRYNQNKLRWRNVPMFLLKPLIEVGAYGEEKYDTFNYLKGMKMNDSLDSLKRHLELFESPYESDNDAESKINHLAHVAWNALIALHNLKTRPDLDDRFKLPENNVDIDEQIRRGR